MKRKHFLKFLGGAIIAPFATTAVQSMPLVWAKKNKNKVVRERQHWTNTIFVETKNPSILMALEKYATETGCHLESTSEPDNPDIIAIPHFAAVLDRRVLSKEIWNFYLDFKNATGSDEMCITIDNESKWRNPKSKCFYHTLNAESPDCPQKIIQLISEFRWAYLNR